MFAANKQVALKCFGSIAVVAIGLLPACAQARSQVQITGSSTVLPYAKIVAETFGEIYPDYNVPVIESGGTGAGVKEFCSGVGENSVDIVNASRPMSPTEIQSCYQAGVKEIEEIRFGYDGIVFASDINGPSFNLSPSDVYKALAAEIIVDGKLQANPYTRWNQVNAALPNQAITAYIPGEKHGTREVFDEKLMIAGCQETGAQATFKEENMPSAQIKAKCASVRKDGRAVDIDGDYSETLARIQSDNTALGVFGLAFYENNADRLRVATISGVEPTDETIVNGHYPVSRPLYFYVKKAHLDVIMGLREYVELFLSDQMIGPDGPLVEYGLVAAPEAERIKQRENFEQGIVIEQPQ